MLDIWIQPGGLADLKNTTKPRIKILNMLQTPTSERFCFAI